MSDKRTESQQIISKEMLEEVKLLTARKKKQGKSNTQTVRERIPVDRHCVKLMYPTLLWVHLPNVFLQTLLND